MCGELGEKKGVGDIVQSEFLGPSVTVNKDQTAVEDEEDKKSIQTPVTSESFPHLCSQVLSPESAALELLPNCISGFLHENSV